uniref:Uncharacterized protein n=1 Tax=Rhinolophus ferrumequinum TaxID=59479 RepID=A0A671E2A1_RHIFE
MVKLNKETKQRVKQHIKGSQCAVCWDIIPLAIYLVYFGGKRLFGHLYLEAINE